MVKWFMVAAILVGCGGGSQQDEARARASRCERLRDHLVELRLASATNLGEDLAQHRAALTQALGPQFVDTCARSSSEAEVTCALAAQDSQAEIDCHASTTASNGALQ